MTRDHDIERSDRGSGCRQLGADLARVFGGAEVKIEELQASEKAFDDVEVAPDGLRSVRAVKQLHRRDTGCADLSIMCLKMPVPRQRL